jgi:hypothetical protein
MELPDDVSSSGSIYFDMGSIPHPLAAGIFHWFSPLLVHIIQSTAQFAGFTVAD